jgi:hypothetical protein
MLLSGFMFPLQQLGEGVGRRIPEPERSGERHRGNCFGEPKADLVVDRSGHGDPRSC